jgi:hypothetical protein
LTACQELVRLATATATADDDWTVAIDEAAEAIAKATGAA